MFIIILYFIIYNKFHSNLDKRTNITVYIINLFVQINNIILKHSIKLHKLKIFY